MVNLPDFRTAYKEGSTKSEVIKQII